MKYWWYVKSEEYGRHLYNMMLNKYIEVNVVIYKYEDGCTRVVFMSNISQNKARKLFDAMVNTFRLYRQTKKLESARLIDRNEWIFPYPPDDFHCCKVCGGWKCGHKDF